MITRLKPTVYRLAGLSALFSSSSVELGFRKAPQKTPVFVAAPRAPVPVSVASQPS